MPDSTLWVLKGLAHRGKATKILRQPAALEEVRAFLLRCPVWHFVLWCPVVGAANFLPVVCRVLCVLLTLHVDARITQPTV